jgi:hypothetical protein
LVTAFRILGDDSRQSIVSKQNAMGSQILLAVDQEPMSPVAAQWTRTEYVIPKPSRRRGDFFDASSGNFACGTSVLEKMRPCIERDCEVLPITIEGLADDDYFLIHPITVIRALPPGLASRSRDLIMSFNAPKYDRSAFDRAVLFRDPQQRSSSVCISGLGPGDLDFYAQYQRHNFSGLVLRKIWEHP